MEEETPKIEPEKQNTEKTGAQSFWELARFALLAIAIVIPIRIFIAQPFIVSGSSMFPTFENSEYLIVDELSYRLSDPKRQDVVIFRYPNDTKKFFIKRIIGLPNETVDIKNGSITITNKEYPDGFTLVEPYVKNSVNDSLHFEVKDKEYFVMGDNRSASSDSRFWGAVPRKLFMGRAFVRLFPVNKVSVLPGNYKQPN